MNYEIYKRIIPPDQIPYYLVKFNYKGKTKMFAIDCKFMRTNEDDAVKWILDNWESLEGMKNGN